MKIEVTKAWCLRMAHFEGDAEIGAGLLALGSVLHDDIVPKVVQSINICKIVVQKGDEKVNTQTQ